MNVYGAGGWSSSSTARPEGPSGPPPTGNGGVSVPPVVNNPPSFGSAGSLTLAVNENLPPGTLVGEALTATDPDGDTLTYSLSGPDASFSNIDSAIRQLTVNVPLDHEVKPVYTVRVWVKDSGNATAFVDVIITVPTWMRSGLWPCPRHNQESGAHSQQHCLTPTVASPAQYGDWPGPTTWPIGKR